MTARRTPVRGAHPQGRRPARPVRRVSAGLSPVRAGAILGLLMAGASIYGVSASSAFAFRRVELPELRYTDPAVIRSVLPVTDGANLFALSTEPLARRILQLLTIAAARVEVGLPDRLVIHIEERSPILVWQVGERAYLVDRHGVLFAIAEDAAAPGDRATLPVVDDHRVASLAGLEESNSIDPIVLDAATRLASLRPIDIGSVAAALTVELGDESGFVVRALPLGWSAIFGFYTASLRTTDLIPGQVRLLRSLLADREPMIERIILADDSNGTYLPKTTPRPTATARP